VKKLILVLVILTIVTSSAYAKNTTVVRDKHGNYQGKYVTEGSTTRIYKKNGDADGSYRKSGNQVKRYAKNGNLVQTYRED